MASIKRLPEKVVRNWFWKQANSFMYPHMYPVGTFDRETYLQLFAVMCDKGWLDEDEFWLLKDEGLPEE